MRHSHLWREGKYGFAPSGRFQPRLGAEGVAPASWLFAALTAAAYQEAMPRCCRGHLLDLGCGTAPLFPLYQRLAVSTVLADWPQTLHPSPCLDCYLDVGQTLPFCDGAFDTVILSDVLEHLSDPAGALCEIHRVMARGGTLLLSVPFLYRIHEAPHDYFRYTEHGLRHLARKAGFCINSIAPLGGMAEVMVDWLAKAMHELHVPSRVVVGVQRVVHRWRQGRVGSGQALTLGYFVELQRG